MEFHLVFTSKHTILLPFTFSSLIHVLNNCKYDGLLLTYFTLRRRCLIIVLILSITSLTSRLITYANQSTWKNSPPSNNTFLLFNRFFKFAIQISLFLALSSVTLFLALSSVTLINFSRPYSHKQLFITFVTIHPCVDAEEHKK